VLLTGKLPPGPLGRLTAAELALQTQRFFERVAKERGTGRASLSVHGADYAVHGELDGLRDDAMVLWRPAVIKAKDRLRAFLLHALKCAANEQGHALPPLTLLLGTDDQVPAPSCSPALPHLDALIAGFRAGRAAALPYLPVASPAFVDARRRGLDAAAALAKARGAYERDRWGGPPGTHDLPDPFLEFCFRDQDPLLLPAFAEWAMRIYEPAATFFNDEGGE
jgi:exodeoxyribonuclease V gamma subunit